MIPKEELLPPTPPQEKERELILLVQVTVFSCGGFVIGYRSSHAVADGTGAAQFMTVVGQLARGAEVISIIELQWSRELMPDPSSALAPVVIAGLPDPSCAKPLEYLAVDISADQIGRLKKQYNMAYGGVRCSAFDVVVAKAWQSRTRAVGFDADTIVHLCFAMNTRALLRDMLPRGGAGFYGNSYYIMRVSATAGMVARSSVTEVVRIIQEGKRRMPAEFARWAAGEMPVDVDPYRITADYRTLLVSDWTRLGFAEVDYGWGPPVHVVPLTNLSYVATCILVRPSAHKTAGARLITQCITADRVADFHQGMLDMS
nr:unnamed protein product [Digitaria exilis]